MELLTLDVGERVLVRDFLPEEALLLAVRSCGNPLHDEPEWGAPAAARGLPGHRDIALVLALHLHRRRCWEGCKERGVGAGRPLPGQEQGFIGGTGLGGKKSSRMQ